MLVLAQRFEADQSFKVFDIQSGKATNTPIEHTTEILEMNLNQVEMSSERKICFIDNRWDADMSEADARKLIEDSDITNEL